MLFAITRIGFAKKIKKNLFLSCQLEKKFLYLFLTFTNKRSIPMATKTVIKKAAAPKKAAAKKAAPKKAATKKAAPKKAAHKKAAPKK